MNKTKSNNWQVTTKFLEFRHPKYSKFKKAKWIEFCETLLADGFTLYLYEARKTNSKYITINAKNGAGKFKVRFSDHKPIKHLEIAKDCDFFVGVTHLGVTNTTQALDAVREWSLNPPKIEKRFTREDYKKMRQQNVSKEETKEVPKSVFSKLIELFKF